jgi:cytochrome P450
MPTISTTDYVLDKAKRRITTSPFLTVPGMGAVEKRLLARDWPQHSWADPPACSELKPVMGDNGLPILGHMIEMFRGGPDYWLHLYRTKGPLSLLDSPILPSVVALGPDAIQALYTNRNKDFSQQGWVPAIGPFFKRGLMLLDFDEHMYHRRIMQEAFVRTRLAGYTEHVDKVVSQVISNDWVTNDARFLLYPAMKELTLDIASMVFMGHEPGTDKELVTKVNRAFTVTTRAGNAIIRTSVPPFTWWRGLKAREYLENYFDARVKERRGKDGNDLLTVLCHSEDEDGNTFSDEDIVNHMIFLLMAAHDTSTITMSSMAYHLARFPEWQEKARAESVAAGDCDYDGVVGLELLDRVMKESMRLCSPVPSLPRVAVRETSLNGYRIPEGAFVTVSPFYNHHDPAYWPDPTRFDPDRFSAERREDHSHRMAFEPFGGGVHKCIGMHFAGIQVRAIFHELLRTYRWSVPDDYVWPLDLAALPFPRDRLPVRLERL